MAIAAIRPDVSLFHAPYADRFGNVFIGRQREVATMAHASAETYVTVERIVEGDLTQDVERAGSTIPAIYVSGIAVVPQGAAPLECPRHYARDEATLRAYARAAATPEGFAAWLDAWLAEEREAVPA